MARDLHDVLAHSLAALSVQLEAAHSLLARPDGAAEARALIDGSRVLVREGLDEARRAVEALDGAHEMPGALHGLAARFERRYRRAVRRDGRGPLARCPRGATSRFIGRRRRR